MRFRLALPLALSLVTACWTGRNYPDTNEPRYTGGVVDTLISARPGSDTLRVVSFNIAFAVHVDSAIAVLTGEAGLRNPDLVLLQEMDEAGTKRIAEALGLAYTYYPAILSTKTGRDFGNAILSRWPFVEDTKIVLPHLAVFNRTQRIATAATIRVGADTVRVYSAHLATFINIGPRGRRDQMRAILADAAAYPRVIIGGDMNNHSIGKLARAEGYAWPTEKGPRTTAIGRWDHIFVKGLAVPDSAAAGTVLDVRHASDHKAVWARAILR